MKQTPIKLCNLKIDKRLFQRIERISNASNKSVRTMAEEAIMLYLEKNK